MDYFHDPAAPAANSLVVGASAVVTDGEGGGALAVSSESTEVRFAAVGDLPVLQIHPSIRTRIQDYLSGQAPVLR